MIDTSLYFSPTVLQIWKRTVEPVPLLIPVFHQVGRLLAAEPPMVFLQEMRAVIQLRTQVAAASPAMRQDLMSDTSLNVTRSGLILRGDDKVLEGCVQSRGSVVEGCVSDPNTS